MDFEKFEDSGLIFSLIVLFGFCAGFHLLTRELLNTFLGAILGIVGTKLKTIQSKV